MVSTIDGDEIVDVTIDGEPVDAITVDGDLVWEARTVIDDFEWGGPVTDRYDTGGSGSTEITSSAALATDSTAGLHQTDGEITLSHPTDGTLDNYIEDGEAFQFLIQPNVFGSQQYWLFFCFSSDSEGTGSIGDVIDSYRIEHIMSGTWRIQKNGSTLDSISFNFGNIPYLITVLADSSSGIDVTLAEYNSGNPTVVETLSASDTEFIESVNGIGYRCSGSGDVFWDDVIFER